MERDTLAAVRRELLQSIDEKTRESAQRFFKEEVKFHGVKSALVKKIATKYFREIKDRDKKEIFSLCENLLQAGFGEEAFIAFEWSYSLRRQFVPEDFIVFERWVDLYVDNWAKCDTLCNHTLGTFVEMYPQFIDSLAVWARAENRWLRRASAVTLIFPARKGHVSEGGFRDIGHSPHGQGRHGAEGLRLAAQGSEQRASGGGLRLRDEEKGEDAQRTRCAMPLRRCPWR